MLLMPRKDLRPAACALAILAAACSTADGGEGGSGDSGLDGDARQAMDGFSPCGVGFLGDPSQPPDFELTFVGADTLEKPLHDGDALPLIFPPQGGRVVFVGVRAKNLDGCALQISGAIRDEQNKAVRVDSRTVVLNPTGDGWGVTGSGSPTVSSQISNFSNIALCPNEWSVTNVFGSAYALVVTLTDAEKRTATKTIHVTPACAEPDRAAECLCICQKGYVLGQQCVADAGVDAAADAGVEASGATDAGDGG